MYGNICVAKIRTQLLKLTNIGLEVEGLEQVDTIKGGLRGLVVGKVTSRSQHPDADRLSVTTVDVGTDTEININKA